MKTIYIDACEWLHITKERETDPPPVKQAVNAAPRSAEFQNDEEFNNFTTARSLPAVAASSKERRSVADTRIGILPSESSSRGRRRQLQFAYWVSRNEVDAGLYRHSKRNRSRENRKSFRFFTAAYQSRNSNHQYYVKGKYKGDGVCLCIVDGL